LNGHEAAFALIGTHVAAVGLVMMMATKPMMDVMIMMVTNGNKW
jgi:hypothetical protein